MSAIRNGLRWVIAAMCVWLACCVGSVAQAQAGGAAPKAPANALETAADYDMYGGMTLGQILKIGGGAMYVIAGMSVLTVAFIIYFAMVIRVGQVAPRALHLELIDRLREGALPDARRLCELRPCPLSAVTLIAIDYVKNSPVVSMSMLKDIMEGEGARQADNIQGQTQYLLDIAVISPMIGLLGTVVGLLQAFSGVALDVSAAKPLVLSMGVSKALFATAFGLVVGIPAMAFYGFFRRKASKVVSSLEVASIDVLTALSLKGNK
jgi:biopolymer transport protein ExbB